MRASLVVLALTLGCRDHAREAPAPPPPPTPPADAAGGEPPTAPAHDAAITTPTNADVAVAMDDARGRLQWGVAYLGNTGLFVELYSVPKSCATRRAFESDLDGFHVRFELPAGPGGRFFAGTPVGVQVLVESSGNVKQVHPALGAMNVPLVISPPLVELRVEPFALRAGQHVRGTIEGLEHLLIGTASVKGSFDVELCGDLSEPPPAMPTAVPSGPVRGTTGGKRIAPRTVHAIIGAFAASHDEAVDVTIKRRPRGSLDYVWMLVFYDQPNVPCPVGSDYDPDAHHVFRVQGPGGASAARPLLGAPQPASTIFPKPGDDYGAIWDTWVRFDAVAFAPGAHVTGALVARPSQYEDIKGSLGGQFDAVVCIR